MSLLHYPPTPRDVECVGCLVHFRPLTKQTIRGKKRPSLAISIVRQPTRPAKTPEIDPTTSLLLDARSWDDVKLPETHRPHRPSPRGSQVDPSPSHNIASPRKNKPANHKARQPASPSVRQQGPPGSQKTNASTSLLRRARNSTLTPSHGNKGPRKTSQPARQQGLPGSQKSTPTTSLLLREASQPVSQPPSQQGLPGSQLFS